MLYKVWCLDLNLMYSNLNPDPYLVYDSNDKEAAYNMKNVYMDHETAAWVEVVKESDN